MKYNKIRGKSVAECMMKLRSEYGSSAIILATREVKEGGLLGSSLMSRKLYEIDFMIHEGEGKRRPAPASDRKDQIRSVLALAEEARSRPAPKPPAPVQGLEQGEQAALNDLFRETEASPAPTRAEPESPAPAAVARPTRELEERPQPAPRREAVLVGGGADDRGHRNLDRIRQRLLSAQLSAEFTDSFLHRLDDHLSRKEKDQYRQVEKQSMETLCEMIRTVPDIAPPTGECRAVALLGPTGSGKTTSVAKLAARYHIYEARDVSIYSLDHYRLAATEQMKTYASVMGLPFFAPPSVDEFSEQLRRDGAELMLIDTSGISHRDINRMEQISEYLDACREEVRLETHLVIAASTSAPVVEKILLAYDRVGFDKIILTKLDESDFIGAFVELADKYNRPFSFLMNGQDVPGDILEASSEQMARMVLDEDVTISHDERHP